MSLWNGNSTTTSHYNDTTSTNKSATSSVTGGSEGVNPNWGERDEVRELQQLSRKDTGRIRLWRILLLLSLVTTGTACTIAFHQYLDDEQNDNYRKAYSQFSQAAGDMTLKMHKTVLKNIRGFAETYAGVAEAMNVTWPYYTMPHFQLHAASFRQRTGAEILMTAHVVPGQQSDRWLNYTAEYATTTTAEADDEDVRYMKQLTSSGWAPDDLNRAVYTAMWQQAPAGCLAGLVNYNPNFLLPQAGGPFAALAGETLMTEFQTYNPNIVTEEFHEWHQSVHTFQEGSRVDHPHVWFVHPVYADPELNGNRENVIAAAEAASNSSSSSSAAIPSIVAHLAVIISLDHCLINLLPDNVKGLRVVLKNSCGEAHTYQLDGKNANYIGVGALFEERYTSMKAAVDLAVQSRTNPEFRHTPGHCLYEMEIYPTDTFRSLYRTNSPTWVAVGMAATFAVIIAIFVVYDGFVQRRNFRLVANAARSNAIVTSLFPGNFRDQLINNEEHQQLLLDRRRFSGTSQKLQDFINGKGLGSEPLAELYLETTIIFADIVGFTAWSSVREPTQVFLLLETIYGAFDELAKRRRVYKVETVGDCYVAVSGLQESRKDHAIVMARFARDLRRRMKSITRELETTFGPDTATLSIRIGLHSGPVTAGVLRGDRPRFQLFGDTMNTCALLESTGKPGQIHVSQETANAIAKCGKMTWVRPRIDKIEGNGVASGQTYWLTFGANPKNFAGSVWDGSDYDGLLDAGSSGRRLLEGSFTNLSRRDSNSSSSDSLDSDDVDSESRIARLVEWNVDKLAAILREIVARRHSGLNNARGYEEGDLLGGKTPLEEVKEIIYLPDFQDKGMPVDPMDVTLPKQVVDQLREYILCISRMYRDNAFHNFDHASHVVMSVTKLMSRIVAPSELNCDDDGFIKTLHDHTYGITSDPLTQFACAFSALIHDVDHMGVPNPQVAKECPALAAVYKHRSVAEQNSLDLSWELFTEPRFEDLRRELCATREELQRFRQLVVNAVMATDIMDKELKELRNGRWAKAFQEQSDGGTKAAVNRKATIVIEHIIQASDVAHTMQHWHIYRKWNERLFREMYQAYLEGRAEKDPSIFWYKGEIGFLDFYVIPLAKKLKECGVFGVSSGEYLNYAQQNRKHWKTRGEEVVRSMLQSIQRENNDPESPKDKKESLDLESQHDDNGDPGVV